MCALRGCDRPSPSWLVCSQCWWRVESDLAELPGLVRQLEVTLVRQVRIGDRSPRGAAAAPLPFDLRASRVSVEVRVELVGLVRLVVGERVPVVGPVCAGRCAHRSCAAIHGDDGWPADTLAEIARWLYVHRVEVRRHPALAELAETILRLRRRIRHVIDRPPDRVYVGQCGARVEAPANADCPCDCHRGGLDVPCSVLGGCGSEYHRPEACEADLYAEPGSATVRCTNKACRTEWDVEVRRRVLLDAAQDVLAHAELIGRALPILGEEVTPNVIQGYARRGRIVACGHDDAGRALYRVGDVLEVVRENARRRQAAERRKAELSAKRATHPQRDSVGTEST